MKVILMTDVEKTGVAGDVLKVKDGFARNYLLPKKLAIVATKNNMNRVATIKEKAEVERLKKLDELKAWAKALENVVIRFERKADENGHLFGSVSETDIAHELDKKEMDIHKSMIQMEKHIKEIGETMVPVKFSAEVVANLKVIVAKEEEAVEAAVETIVEEIVEETVEETEEKVEEEAEINE